MKKYSVAATLIILSCLVASSLFAYTLLSPRRTWDSPPTIILDNRGIPSIDDGDFGVSHARNALLANVSWNGAGTGTRFSVTVGSMTGFSMGDGRPYLNFRDPAGACTGNCLAATFTGYYQSRGNGTYRITDADIVTNAFGFDWASTGEPCFEEIYIEAVAVHEVGHLLGLGHSGVGGATMFPNIGYCDLGPASLATDDRNAINDLY